MCPRPKIYTFIFEAYFSPVLYFSQSYRLVARSKFVTMNNFSLFCKILYFIKQKPKFPEPRKKDKNRNNNNNNNNNDKKYKIKSERGGH